MCWVRCSLPECDFGSKRRVRVLSARVGPGSAQVGPAGAQVGPVVAQVGPAGAQAGPAGAQVGPAGAQVEPVDAQVGTAGAQVGTADAQVGPAGAQVGTAGAQVGRGNGCMCDKMPEVHEFPLKSGIAEPKCLTCTIIITYNGKSSRKAAISAQNRPFYRENRAKQRFLPTPVRNIDEIVQSSDFGTQSAEPHAGGRRSQRLDGCRSG